MTRRAAWLLLGAWLAGCATTPPTTVVPPPSLSGEAPPTTWSATGRLAINVAGQGGSAGFFWRQQEARSDVVVRGPLGVGLLDVTLDGDVLSVTDGAGVTVSGEPARAQVQAKLGADLPLSSLRYWAVARPDPATDADVQDAAEPPRRVIVQNGWRVVYDEFGRFDGLAAPVRFAATNGDVKLRLVLDRWQFGPALSPPR